MEIGQTLRLELVGPRLCPVAVAGNGIDLTIVGQQAEWLCQRPARHGVGGEALVKHADRRLKAAVAQIGIEAGQSLPASSAL